MSMRTTWLVSHNVTLEYELCVVSGSGSGSFRNFSGRGVSLQEAA
jgi:hypothetical protein